MPLKCCWCKEEIYPETGNFVNDDGDEFHIECYMRMTQDRKKATKFREWATNYVLSKVWTTEAEHFRYNLKVGFGQCNCDGCRVIKLWINSLLEDFEVWKGPAGEAKKI